jgi:hypothetical protein
MTDQKPAEPSEFDAQAALDASAKFSIGTIDAFQFQDGARWQFAQCAEEIARLNKSWLECEKCRTHKNIEFDKLTSHLEIAREALLRISKERKAFGTYPLIATEALSRMEKV